MKTLTEFRRVIREVRRKLITGMAWHGAEEIAKYAHRYRDPVSGETYEIFYDVMVWRDDWRDWDLYAGAYSLREVEETLRMAFRKGYRKIAVEVGIQNVTDSFDRPFGSEIIEVPIEVLERLAR